MVASIVVYTRNAPSKNKCSVHCVPSYSSQPIVQVSVSARASDLKAIHNVGSCRCQPCRIHCASTCFVIWYAFVFAMNQVTKVAAMVGRSSLPERARALRAMPLKAASWFPARDLPIGPIELTYPVTRKNRATALRPPTARRKKGSWKRCGGVLGSCAGWCSHGTKAVHR
jgi:hypothetical protein